MTHIQKEYIGRGNIKYLKDILKQCNPGKVFLVSGQRSFQSCGAKADIEKLLQGYEFVTFNDFSPNPTIDEALKGSDLFKKEKCDFILAVGGGSPIDMAKIINAFQAHEGREHQLAKGSIKISKTLVPSCVIPTTAGTGSEATHFAVVYVEGKKYSLADNSLLPDYVILDATYTDNLPAYITACTGFDALCQAIESFWAKGATTESRGYATKAIPLLLENIEQAVKECTDKAARDAMLLGANYAGKAINISKTTAPHALSYAITSATGLPHGHAVALTLGNFFIINNNCLDKNDNSNIDAFVLNDLYQLMNVHSAQEAQSQWYEFMKKCRLDFNKETIGLNNPEIIEGILKQVNAERLGNHPFQLSNDDLKVAFSDVG